MDIECFKKMLFNTELNRYVIETPLHQFYPGLDFREYIVQKGEEMRPDLLMESLYGDFSQYVDLDIITYINGIDNPINIREGQIILYPNLADLENFRYSVNGSTPEDDIKDKLGLHSKSSRNDKNRDKFIDNGYSLPPVTPLKSKQPVRIQGDKIIIGGLK